jgi:predicted hydrocarbon binding protein
MLTDKIPNSMMYVTLLTVEEILGKNGLNSILNLGKMNHYRDHYPPNNEEMEIPVEHFMKVISTAIEIYGENGAKSVLYNCGRKAFRIILEENPSLMGLVGLGLKVLPKKKRAQKILETTSNEGNKIFGENQRFYVTDDGFVTEIYDCFYCVGLKSKTPICAAEVGFEYEALLWATGDEYEIKEVLCKARGDDVCKFVASSKPKKQ